MTRGAFVVVFAMLLLGSSPAVAAPPPNDNFANAQSLPAAASVPGTTVESTREPGEPIYYDLHDGNSDVSGDGSVWYAWTAPRSSRFRVATCGSSELTAVDVFSGPGFGALTEVPSEGPAYMEESPNCPFGDKGQGFLFEATGGTTYHLAVVNVAYGFYGPFQLTLADLPVPVKDGGVSQTASRKVVKSGRTVTYKTTLRNLGNVPFEGVWLHLVATKPGGRRNPGANYDRPAKKVRVLRVRTTRGSCARYPKFYKGSFCAIGRLEPGQQAVVTATLRLRESITYWGSLDYSPGTGDPVPDAQPNNDNSFLVTRVRRVRR